MQLAKRKFDRLMHQIIHQPPPPRTVDAQVPMPLEKVCVKALAKNKEERYAGAGELAQEIEHWLADEPVSAWLEPWTVRARRWLGRHRALATSLAAALLVALLLGGVGAWWLERQRADHEAELARQDGIREAEQRLRRDHARQQVLGALGQARQLWSRYLWREAKDLLSRAEKDASAAGLENLQSDVRQALNDTHLAEKLDEIRLDKSVIVEDKFDYAEAAPAYARAFADFGLDLKAANVAELARRIKASAIKEQLIAALDDWYDVERDPQLSGRLLAVARLADEDVWRQRLRDPAVWKDKQALKHLAKEEGALAQPPLTAQILARYLFRASEPADAVGVLRQAQQRHPGNFWVNYHLAVSLMVSEPSRDEEAIGFLRAAVAVRPQSAAGHATLGAALAEQGRYKEAESACRSAIAF